jgi:hypothetical protein
MEIRTKPVTREYEAGFERTFAERQGQKGGRWIYDPALHAMVRLTPDWQPESRRVPVVGDSHYDGLRSPMDGADISSRTKHREYMRRHGLTTTDDYKDTWAKAAKDREASIASDKSRREEIGRAWYQQETRRGR